MSGFLRKVVLINLVASLPLVAHANNFNYNLLEMRLGGNPNTFGAEYNVGFTENTHLIVRADSELSGDWDIAAGAGFNGPVNQFADMFGQLILHNIKENSSQTFGRLYQMEFNVGTRVWITNTIEATGRIGKQFINDDDSRTVFGMGVRFHSTEELSVGMELRKNITYGHQMLMTVRFHF